MKTFFRIAGLCALLILALARGNVYAQKRGGDLEGIASENLGPQTNIGKQYALFIAVDAYRYWPALKKPVSDAKEIRDILKKDYYIDEVFELYNAQASKANITRTFSDLQSKLGVHDSLFIYYAGHGHLDKNSNAGFWIPVDGGTDQYEQSNWLPNSQIRGYISQFKTIHVFMVSDACFSGDILSTTRALPPQIDNAYYRKAYALTSRQVLTSGSSETVPDQSEFSSALINCLRKNTTPMLDPLGIYNDVRLSIKSTTPLYGTLNAANHQDGATFLFFRRQATTKSAPTTQEQSVSAATTSISPAPVSASNSDEIISQDAGWETENDDSSSSTMSFGKERIDGRERDVLTININLVTGSSRWAGVYSYKTDFVTKLKNANGVRFKILGDGKKWSVYFSTSDVTDNAFHRTIISTKNGKVTDVNILFSGLKQPDWGKKTEFKKNNIATIGIQRDATLGSFGVSTVKIFDFEIY